MAALAAVWAAIVAYELVAPRDVQPTLTLVGNVIWVLFACELLAKLIVSGRPVRFLRRHWPSVLFLVLPALRMLRVVRALRAVRVLPAARVIGSSYRAVGTARGLLAGRLQFLLVATGLVVFGAGQLLFVLERGRPGALTSLGDALWWAANLAIASNLVHEPVTLAGRLLAIVLSAYAIVVFASVAASLGAFFVESRQERAADEDARSAARTSSDHEPDGPDHPRREVEPPGRAGPADGAGPGGGEAPGDVAGPGHGDDRGRGDGPGRA
jgi:voltage-gated potassium channel